jgi:hypothetical protein
MVVIKNILESIYLKFQNLSIHYFAFRIFEKYLSKISNRGGIKFREARILLVKDKISKWKTHGRKLLISPFFHDDYLENYLLNTVSSIATKFEIQKIFDEKSYRNSIIILNGNDFADKKIINKISKMRKISKDTIFMTYLYDNHHLISHSLLVAGLSDIVVIAHPDFKNLIEAYVPIVIGPVPAPIQSWNLQELEQFQELIEKTTRSVNVGGMYYRYDNFLLRNEFIELIQKNNPGFKVGFTEDNEITNYHQQTPLEKMKEWTNFKTSLIVPVSDDIPIRLFDALITGSIPIVPKKLKNKIESLNEYENIKTEIYWYDESDISNFNQVVCSAIKHFEEGGINEIRLRSNWALKFQSKEIVLSKIISSLEII